MQSFRNQLEERIQKLQKIKREQEKSLKNVPSGTIHISKSAGRTQFYLNLEGEEKRTEYFQETD